MFEIPEQGTAEWVDLLCRLDRARYENANAWVVISVDDDSGEICDATGPFPEAEMALVKAGRMDADWKETEDEESGTWTYKIVPIWAPGE